LPSTTTPTDGAENTVDLGTNHHRKRLFRPPEPRGPRRPERRSPSGLLGSLSRLGYAMRFVAGVDEELMDKVRWERSWYTSLGGVVLGTATIAAFSMWFAVTESVVASSVAALLPALIWFMFIMILDRWIISTRSTDPWQRLFLLCTRGFLAVLFGVAIAEPLVLRVFQTQVEHQVRTDRADAIRSLQTNLLRCNPDPGDGSAPAAPDFCVARSYVLPITTTPAFKLRQLVDLKTQSTDLQKKIDSETDTLEALNKKATDECAGHSGSGLTGVWGDGINCEQDKANAKQFADSHPIKDEQTALAAINKQIVDLQTEITQAQGTFRDQREEAIRIQVEALPQVDAPIGLLERMAALAELGRRNLTLAAGIFLVRLLFITIDCLPVLMKVASGSTYYDKLVLSSLEDASKTHDQELEGKDSEREMRREEQEQRKREHAIEMQQRLADAVDARAAAYERQARQHP
jgi:hypothetical protein